MIYTIRIMFGFSIIQIHLVAFVVVFFSRSFFNIFVVVRVEFRLQAVLEMFQVGGEMVVMMN